MDRAIIARNLLIFKQIEEAGTLLSGQHIPSIVLKGAALICAVPDYCQDRVMEDIDLLVRPKDIEKARQAFKSKGYSAATDDPQALIHPQFPASLDITDAIWYLSTEQNKRIWNDEEYNPLEGMPCGMYRLRTDDLFMHVLAHAAVHHARKEIRWLRDLEVIKERWGNEIDWGSVDRKLEVYGLKAAAELFLENKSKGFLTSIIYRWVLKKDHPEGGHIARFLFLPLRRKLSFLLRTIFPSKEFVKTRYSLNSSFQLWAFRFFRPFLLLQKLLSVAIYRCKV